MGLKIDEIRSFVAVAETGSFSAAARNLKRAQSVVCKTARLHLARLKLPPFIWVLIWCLKHRS